MRRCFLQSKNNESGQSLVELALFLPILLLLVLGIIQFGIILGGQITVTSAAREGARAAVVGRDDEFVRERVKDFAETLLLERLRDDDITITPDQDNRVSGNELSVHVSGRVPILVPTFGILAGSHFNVTSEAVMRVEQTFFAGGGEGSEPENGENDPDPEVPMPGPDDPPRIIGETISWTGNGRRVEVVIQIVTHEGPYSVGTVTAQLQGLNNEVEEEITFVEQDNQPGFYSWKSAPTINFSVQYPGQYKITIEGIDGEVTIN